MAPAQDNYEVLLRALLPVEIFDYFDIVNVIVSDNNIDLHLDERDSAPEEYQGYKLTSKGFHATSVIQDFPIRNRSLFLHIRRRRWLVESTGEVVSRNWDTVAKGTRLTKGFAVFLKGLFGQLPHKQ